jgi:hypothetical protein
MTGVKDAAFVLSSVREVFWQYRKGQIQKVIIPLKLSMNITAQIATCVPCFALISPSM